ncbi:MAG: matrixin family metalloprotease, partial [Magnetococcales bacterium]|nr:matrixin family metalloprotease [Magnetococcales bacterium]
AYTGLAPSLCRWESGTMKVLYNPKGAPKALSAYTMIQLIEKGFSQWESASRIKVYVQGITSKGIKEIPEGYVLFYWGDLESLGRGGCNACSTISQRRLGYNTCLKGHMKLSTKRRFWENRTDSNNEKRFVRALTHELGHVLGLGHSEHPYSIMYANPYNDIATITDDDVEGIQALYGRAPRPFQLFKPITDLIHRTPPHPAAKWIKAEIFDRAEEKGASLISQVDETTPISKERIMLKVRFRGLRKGRPLTVLVIDPFGHERNRHTFSINFPNGWVAVTGLTSVKEIRSIPGQWHIMGQLEGKRAFLKTIPSRSAPFWNQPPRTRMAFDRIRGRAPLSVQATFKAVDPEGDSISSTWHIPGLRKPKRFLNQNRIQHSFTLRKPGKYTLFIAVNDDAKLYGRAGVGFRRLLHQEFIVDP